MDDSVYAGWVGRHWWSETFELMVDGHAIASIHAKGARAIAKVGNVSYTLARLRAPDYITLRLDVTDDLIARYCVVLCPSRIPNAEFADGEVFQLSCIRAFKREATWSRPRGDVVLWSSSRWFDNVIRFQVDRAFAYDKKWPLLALLEIAPRLIRQPFF